jgi:hypothetical protein
MPGCDQTWIFLDRFSKNTEISNFVKIRPVGAELFHVKRRTDRRRDIKPIVAFRNFSKATKKVERAWPKVYGIPTFEPFCYRQASGYIKIIFTNECTLY